MAAWYVEHLGFTIKRKIDESPFMHFIADGSGMDRGTMLKPAVMGPPAAWLASTASDGFTGRRIVAAFWDPALADHRAVADSASPIGWPDLAQSTRVWPKEST